MNLQETYNTLFALIIPIIVVAQDIQISSIPLPSYYTPSTIVGLDQDKYGNIWMANTNQGMLKYNGEDFKIYTSIRNNSNSLISNRLECIHIDKLGYIWIGSFASGLSRYDPSSDTFVHFVHDENDPSSIRSNGIRSIAEDRNGGMWIGSLRGIDYWNPESEKFEDVLGDSPDKKILEEEHVRVIYVDNAGMIWAGSSSPFFGETTEGGLFKIDPRTSEVKRYAQNGDSKSITDNIVTAILEDSRGNFWVGTSGDGLHSMDRELGEFTHHSYDPAFPAKLSRSPVNDYEYAYDHIRFIQEDVNGNIWIGTVGNGITKYNPFSHEAIHLNNQRNDQYQLPNNYLWSSLRTDDNQMWFTGWSPTDHNQIFFKANLDPWIVHHTDLNNPIFSFEEGADGAVYMGSEDILFKLDQNENLTRVIEQSGTRATMNQINCDAEGDLWISTVLGLLYYGTQSGSHQMFPLHDEVFGDQIEVTYTDDWTSDSILVGTTSGLYIFDQNEEKFTHIPYTSDEVPDRTRLWINELRVDSRRNIWVGYGDFGLKKLSHDFASFKDYTFIKTVQDGPLAIFEDQYQNLYVGNRRSGLRKYDYKKDSFVAIIDNTGIIDEELGVNGIKTVSDSVIWLMTNKGPLKYDMSTNIASALEVQELNEYDINSRVFSSTKGDYFLGTSNGYIKFKPEDLDRKSTQRYFPSISKMLVGENNFTKYLDESGEGFDLEYNENNVAFTLSYINHINTASTNKLEFQLENYDQHWKTGDNEEEVFYYNLPPGPYEFHVKAVDSLGGEGIKSISFRINPPWWMTWWAYLAYAIIVTISGWRFHKYQRERLLKAEKERRREQELAHAREIEKAYNDLKATQAQLVQSEKMASLGELTAGIAHEIQNPLNFVNNFSDLSAEIVTEINEEREKKEEERDDGIVDELLEDLKSNLEKINHHGARASDIVNNMLDHSRTNTGEKSMVDLNSMCEEYLRLAYHGLRAKDHSFISEYETHLDRTVPKLNVVSQDISRVLLNLINNAFQAVHDQRKTDDNGYAPKVTVTSELEGDTIHISIMDNGPGVSEEIKDKIFQPFFTTKSAGKGTGLGLSLSYDIIKAHGGELSVSSKEHQTIFSFSLPINQT